MVILVDEAASPNPETRNEGSNPASFNVNFEQKTEISYQRRSRIIPLRRQDHRALPAINLTFKRVEYSQQALFCSTEGQSFSLIAEKLRQSLAEVLVEFKPFAAKFQSPDNPDRQASLCDDSSSVDFIEASSVFTLEEAISENSVLLSHLVPNNTNLAMDDHNLPLFLIQVTELRGGSIAMGWATNETLMDAVSARSFLSSWAHLCSEEAICLDSIPYIVPPSPNTPYSLRSKYQSRHQLVVAGSRLRTFYFNSRAVHGLKETANAGRRGSGLHGKPFSIFHSLSAHIWAGITRARDLNPKAITGCSYLGNPASSHSFNGLTTAGKLTKRDLAFAAALLREAVAGTSNLTVGQTSTPPRSDRKNMVWMSRLEGAGPDSNPGSSKSLVATRSSALSVSAREWEDGRVMLFGSGKDEENIGAHIVLSSEAMENLENDYAFKLSGPSELSQ